MEATIPLETEHKVGEFDLLVIDGGHLSHRSLFAFKELSVDILGKEVFTGVPFGIFRELLFLRRVFGGTIMMVWDGGKESRRETDPDYKVFRDDKKVDAIFEHFGEQLDITCALLDYAGVRQYRTKGYEGDELISTICKKFLDKKIAVLSGDHDMYQVVRPGVTLLKPSGREINVVTSKSFREENGYPSEYYWQIQALCGCSGDGVKGLYRVGEKVAYKILAANGWYHALLSKLRNREEILGCNKAIVDQMTVEGIEKTKELTLLRTNVPVKRYKKYEPDMDALLKMLAKYKMFSLLKGGTQCLKNLGT